MTALYFCNIDYVRLGAESTGFPRWTIKGILVYKYLSLNFYEWVQEFNKRNNSTDEIEIAVFKNLNPLKQDQTEHLV